MKLYYFDIYGRAEAIRFALTHSGTAWEDVIINGEKLMELKGDGSLEFGQVPMLELDDGRKIVQSWAILRYVGRTFGYYPTDAETAWRVDSTIDAVEDFLTQYFKFHFEKDEEKKKVAKEGFFNWLPKWLDAIEKRLVNNTTQKYIVGDKITIADFALAALIFSFAVNPANPTFEETLPLLKDREVFVAYKNGLKEELKARLESRPQPRPL